MYKLNLTPDKPDARDYTVTYPKENALLKLVKGPSTPDYVNLSQDMTAVYDQSSLGSCTAQAVCAAHQYLQYTNKRERSIFPSRLYIYYFTRKAAGNALVDSGATIRDTLKTLGGRGACTEGDWPYNIANFAIEPPISTHKDAYKNRIKVYARIQQNQEQIEKCLAEGYPIIFGFMVYSSFYDKNGVTKTGYAKMPNLKSETRLGGHAVLMIGYDRTNKRFLCRNSWGFKFGLNGNFWMPYNYVLNRDLAFDFWSVRSIA
jgi:C1A family cysteine protease